MKVYSSLNRHIAIILTVLCLLSISCIPVAATGAPSPLLGALQVVSTPPGATLVFDHMNEGTTPVTVENILAGSHTVSLRREGYYDYDTDVVIAAGKTTTVSASLVPIPLPANGTLFVNSTPSGAKIIIDDIVAGSTPVTFKNITPGDHIVVINLSGYDDYTETVLVMSNTTSTVDVVLARVTVAPGSILVRSTPSLATVYLDNVNKGITPLSIDNIAPGSHVIVLKKTGYNDYMMNINVISGETVTLSATLTPAGQKSGALNVKSSPSGATIVLDSVNKGSTPMTISNILAGSHVLVLKKTGYKDYTMNVLVFAGKTVNVTITMTKLPPTTGSLAISSIPTGATIVLDGVKKGTTNRTFDGIAPGIHTIEVENTGYVTNTTNVTVVAGGTVTYTAEMLPVQAVTGTLVIKSRPSGATVFLDSANKGYSPITLTNITPGIHSIILRAFNYRPYQTNVNVSAGKIIVLNITMTKS